MQVLMFKTMNINITKMFTVATPRCKLSGFHRNIPMFWRNLLPAHLGLFLLTTYRDLSDCLP
jgi:hypothetical protein